MSVLVAILMALTLGLGGCAAEAPASVEPAVISTPEPTSLVGSQITLENYDKIQEGMTYDEVVDILQSEGNVGRGEPDSDGYWVVNWMTSDLDFNKGKTVWFNIIIKFKDYKVIYKNYEYPENPFNN